MALIRISPLDGSGSATSAHSRTLGGPYFVRTQALGMFRLLPGTAGSWLDDVGGHAIATHLAGAAAAAEGGAALRSTARAALTNKIDEAPAATVAASVSGPVGPYAL